MKQDLTILPKYLCPIWASKFFLKKTEQKKPFYEMDQMKINRMAKPNKAPAAIQIEVLKEDPFNGK